MPTKKYMYIALFLFCINTITFANDTNTTSQTLESKPALTTTYWKLIQLLDEDIYVEKMSREAHIIFSPLEDGQGKFQGASGCNAMLGKYKSSEHNLTIDNKHIAMTLMACPEIKIETQFIHVLGLVRHWKITNNNLLFLDSNSTTLTRFEAVKK